MASTVEIGQQLMLAADAHGNPEELVEVVRRRRNRGKTSGVFEYRVRYLDGANKGELMWETESEVAKARLPNKKMADMVARTAPRTRDPARPDGLSAYERKRLAKIARNEAKLASLGLAQSKASFTPRAVAKKPELSAIALRAKKGVDAARRKRKREARASAPRRTSLRLKGEKTEGFELPPDFRGLPQYGPGRQRVHQQLVAMGQRPGGRNPGERWNARPVVIADGVAVASDRHDRQRVAVAEDGAPLFGKSFVGHLITAFEAEKKRQAKAGSSSSSAASSVASAGMGADEDASVAERKTLRCVARPRAALPRAAR